MLPILTEYTRYTKTPYCSQNYWIFGIFPSSGILGTRKLENTTFRKLQWLRLALSKGSNWIDVFSPHLRMEADPVSETPYFLVPRIPDDEKSPKPQEFWVWYTIVRTLYNLPYSSLICDLPVLHSFAFMQHVNARHFVIVVTRHCDGSRDQSCYCVLLMYTC
jgi:hypothetical protein